MAILTALPTALLLFAAGISAQNATSKAETALTTLQTWYNQTSGLWDTAGWWNGANSMTVIADLAAVDSSIQDIAVEVFNNTFVVAPSFNPAPGVEKTTVNGLARTLYPGSWPDVPALHSVQAVGTVNASAWLDGAYDDDAWWALAWIAAYDVTNNVDYLQLAMGIFDALVSADVNLGLHCLLSAGFV
jgi:hypothetical protein